MIYSNSKKVDRTILLSHFLANQIAGKPVHISCHVIMCWYELAVQFLGPALPWLNGPVLPGSKPTTGKPELYQLSNGEASPQRPELLPPPPPPTPKRRKIGKLLKNGVSLMKRLFLCKHVVFFFEKGMFHFQQECGIEKLPPATCAYVFSSLSSTVPRPH